MTHWEAMCRAFAVSGCGYTLTTTAGGQPVLVVHGPRGLTFIFNPDGSLLSVGEGVRL